MKSILKNVLAAILAFGLLGVTGCIPTSGQDPIPTPEPEPEPSPEPEKVTLEKIEILTMPARLVYFLDEKLSLMNLNVIETYSDGHEERGVGLKASGFDSSAASDSQEVTLSASDEYGNVRSTSFYVKILDTRGIYSYCENLEEKLMDWPEDEVTVILADFRKIELFDAIKKSGKKVTLYFPHSIKEIPDYAVSHMSGNFGIVLPDGYTRIGESAFYESTGLNSVTIPESVTEISQSAFSGCSGLKSVKLPSTLTTLGNNAFVGCTSLESISIPGNVQVIPDSCFKGCTELASVEISSGITAINSQAFGKCNKITSIKIPASVEHIALDAFSFSSALETIEVEAGNEYYSSFDGSNVLVEKSTGKLILGCKNSTIPEGVTEIVDSAFEGFSFSNEVSIPEGVATIGTYAFKNCVGMKSELTIPASVTSIGIGAFEDCNCKKITFEDPKGWQIITLDGTAYDIDPTAPSENANNLVSSMSTDPVKNWRTKTLVKKTTTDPE